MMTAESLPTQQELELRAREFALVDLDAAGPLRLGVGLELLPPAPAAIRAVEVRGPNRRRAQRAANHEAEAGDLDDGDHSDGDCGDGGHNVNVGGFNCRGRCK